MSKNSITVLMGKFTESSVAAREKHCLFPVHFRPRCDRCALQRFSYYEKALFLGLCFWLFETAEITNVQENPSTCQCRYLVLPERPTRGGARLTPQLPRPYQLHHWRSTQDSQEL